MGSLRRKLIGAAAVSCAAALAAPAAAQVDASTLPCNTGAAVKSGDGKTRIAMIVGVGKYRANTELLGAVRDAGRFYDLIVEGQKRVFPKENVCVLTDAEATMAEFKTAFQKALIDRAAGAAEVVFYYAGHGSRLKDDNGDEEDGNDETLFLHDSRKPMVPADIPSANQLRDDDFNALIAALYAKTGNVTVILDSCHSGSATRDPAERARFVEPAPSTVAPEPAAGAAPSRERASFAEFEPASFPTAVFLSAARDKEKAKELPSGGKFTTLLVAILGGPDREKITYDQVMARIKAEMGLSSSGQTPVLTGDGGGRFVFSNDIPYRPRFDWKVSSVAAGVKIRGLPTIGMGEGAEFLIVPGSMTEAEAKKPDIAKARMKAAKQNPQQQSANEWPMQMVKDFDKLIVEGDFAQLVRPSNLARKLKVRLRPAIEPGGLQSPSALQLALTPKLAERLMVPSGAAVSDYVVFAASGFDFEISRGGAGRLQISDPEGIVRNTYQAGADVENAGFMARDLTNHFRQLTLRNDWKMTGGSLTPNKSLQVSLVPVNLPIGSASPDCKQRPQVTSNKWPASANASQRVPLCAFYRIKVQLEETASVSLIIGGSVLSADGAMAVFPKDQSQAVELAPGQEKVLGTFQGDLPTLNKPEHIFVLGLPAVAMAGQPAFEIPWHLLSTAPATKSPTTRGVTPEREYGTYTILPVMTVPNE